MRTENHEYWLSRDGHLYADQQRFRREAGNTNYAKQEEWLSGFLAERSEQLGRPVRVLDFGVGFGRLARVLSQHGFVDYFGFDISRSMVEPLLQDPPPSIAGDLQRRIRVGPSLGEAMQGEQFDVIFTVSVLIHNDREQAADVLSEMRGLLAPQGRLCFIENRPVSISLMANLWHAGCWSHDFVGTLAADMNVDVEDGILPDHGIYVLSEADEGLPRRVRVPGEGGFELIAPADYLLRTLAATTAVARGLEVEGSLGGSEVAALRDVGELYRQAEVQSARNLEIAKGYLGDDMNLPGAGADVLSVVDTIPSLAALAAALREQVDASTQTHQEEITRFQSRQAALENAVADLEHRLHALQCELEGVRASNERHEWQQGLRERVHRMVKGPAEVVKLSAIAAPVDAGGAAWSSPPPPYEFNARRDTCFAQVLGGHERVCHVMHQEWFGIRAACGALPGQKLAVTSNAPPTVGEIDQVARMLAAKGVDRLVIHGFSDGMLQWVKGLAAAGFDRIYLVWHGAPVMWVHAEERRLFALANQAVRSGLIRSLHVMRAGAHAALDRSSVEQPQIYNMPPNFSRRGSRPPRRATGATVFAPSWNLVHKNLFTNVAAAAATDEVSSIWLMADDFSLPYDVDKSLKRLPKLSQLQMMETMGLTDVVMNASIVDCHPMVELEALAAGTPALRGRLGMDELEDHPYVRVTQVEDPLSVADVRRTLRRILAVPAAEMDEMMASYSSQMVALSFARYSELMEI